MRILHFARLWLMLGTLLAGSAFAQPVQNIRGTVVDADTREPLPYAQVVAIPASGEPSAVFADSSGRYKLPDLPLGRYTLQAKYMGYEPLSVPDLQLSSGKELVLDLPLPILLGDENVVVIEDELGKGEALNQMATVSARGFSVTETQRYAAALNDPGRMASGFAGVVASPDGRNDIVIRGNSPAGMLWRLEGVDILNPNHFNNPGSSGGGISIIPNTMLDNSDFLTGAFPAEYGNATSGVFDLNLRKGNDEEHEFTFQIGILGTIATAEGPIKKSEKAPSFLINYRYSTLDILKALDIPNLQGTLPSYQDMGFHFNFPLKKAGEISVFGLGGLSKLNSDAQTDTLNWVYRSDRSQDIFGSDMGVVGVKYFNLFPNHKTTFTANVAVTANRNYYEEDTLNTAFQPFRINEQQFVQGKYVATARVLHRFSGRHKIRAGLIGSRLFYDLNSSGFNFIQDTTFQYLNTDGSTYLVQPHFQWSWRLTKYLTVNSGLHGMWLALNNSAVLEPRFGASWIFSDRQSLGLGYGLHSQILPLGTYFANAQNESLGFQRAHHWVLSYNLRLNDNLRLKSEVYAQKLFNVPIGGAGNPTYSLLNQQWGFALDSLYNDGSGLNYGLEFTLEKFFSRNYYFLLTASLFESKYTPYDGIRRDTRFNGNYAANLLAGKEFHFGIRRKQYIELSGRIVWLGGQRYTPIDLTLSELAGQTVLDESQAFTMRQRDYFRVDGRIAWHRDALRVTHILSFDAQNVFNTQNNFVQRYDPTANAVVVEYQAGLIPVLSYRIDF